MMSLPFEYLNPAKAASAASKLVFVSGFAVKFVMVDLSDRT